MGANDNLLLCYSVVSLNREIDVITILKTMAVLADQSQMHCINNLE